MEVHVESTAHGSQGDLTCSPSSFQLYVLKLQQNGRHGSVVNRNPDSRRFLCFTLHLVRLPIGPCREMIKLA